MTSQTHQLNQASMNMLLQQTAIDLPESIKLQKQVPNEILKLVEKERQRRFEMIMEIPPERMLTYKAKWVFPWDNIPIKA